MVKKLFLICPKEPINPTKEEKIKNMAFGKECAAKQEET